MWSQLTGGARSEPRPREEQPERAPPDRSYAPDQTSSRIWQALVRRHSVTSLSSSTPSSSNSDVRLTRGHPTLPPTPIIAVSGISDAVGGRERLSPSLDSGSQFRAGGLRYRVVYGLPQAILLGVGVDDPHCQATLDLKRIAPFRSMRFLSVFSGSHSFARTSSTMAIQSNTCGVVLAFRECCPALVASGQIAVGGGELRRRRSPGRDCSASYRALR